MPDVVLRGLGAFGNGLNNVLRQRFQVEGAIRDNDVVLRDAVAAAIANRDVLNLNRQIELVRGQEAAVAAELYQQIPPDFRRHQPAPPEGLRLIGGFGRSSNLHEIMERLSVTPEPQIQRYLQEGVIPGLMNDFGARYATGVTLNASQQQAWLSFSKVLMLAQRYDQAEVERRMEQGALDGIFLNVLDVLAFVDALTRLSPVMLTLPVRRHGCAWHFQNEAMWVFQSTPANGLVAETMAILSPLALQGHQFGLRGLAGMGEQNVWRYLRYVVRGINRLMMFLNDLRSFAEADGSVDLLKRVQAYSAIHLLFADLQGVNFSTTSHNRISYAMSAFDKIANLRVQVYPAAEGYREEQAMIELLAQSQGEELKRVLGVSLRNMNYDQLAETVIAVVDRCYAEMHTHLGEQAPEAAASERVRLERLRSQRNIRHGTFLQRNQFEALFFTSDGTVPDTLGTLPLLLTLGLIADPERFLRFRPTVAQDAG